MELPAGHGAARSGEAFAVALSLKPTVTSPSGVTVTGRRTSAGYSAISWVHCASVLAALRSSGSARQVMDVRLTSFSQPPTLPAQALSVAAATG